MLRRLFVPLALLFLLVAACTPPNERTDVARDLTEAVAGAGDDGVLDIGSVAPFDWDTLYAFPGGTTDDQVNEIIGITWAAGGNGSSLAPADGLVLVVFVRDGDVAAWSVLNGGSESVAVRFHSSLQSKPIVKADAIFRADLRQPTVGGNDLFLLVPR